MRRASQQRFLRPCAAHDSDVHSVMSKQMGAARHGSRLLVEIKRSIPVQQEFYAILSLLLKKKKEKEREAGAMILEFSHFFIQ